MLLNALRRTIIPPLWKVCTRIPGGIKFWQWCVGALRISPPRPCLDPVATAAAQLPVQPAESGMQLDFRVVVSETTPDAPVTLCKLSNLPDFENPDWQAVARELGMPTTGTDRLSKKGWEYVHVIYGLKKLECLKPTAKVLSVGCGYEIPMFYLVGIVDHVYGIDLFDGVDDIHEPLERIGQQLGRPVSKERLTLQRMDGCSLEYDDESFEVVFSLSSIEHFGGCPAAAKAMREVGRVLKPGGIAAVATEMVLNDVPHPFFFSIDDLYEFVIQPSGLSLVEPIDFSVLPQLLESPPRVDEVERRPFLVVYWGSALFTSVMVFLRKEGA